MRRHSPDLDSHNHKKGGIAAALGDLLDFFGHDTSADADHDPAEQGPGGDRQGGPEAIMAGELQGSDGGGQNHTGAQAPGSQLHHNPRDRWVHKAPHLPPPGLEDALFNAAYHDGAHGLHASTGIVIAATGNRFTFAKLLQKFLAGLKHSLSGDLSNHAVIVGMGKGAKSICEGLNARYSHHCVLSSYWVGHDTEYDAGDSWHVAAELHKLELILNILTLGYSIIFMDSDTVVYHNPMRHLLSLQADIAVPDAACAVTKDDVAANRGTKLDQDTSVVFARSGPRAVRFLYDWIALHKHDLHRSDRLLRHDKAVFNEVLGLHVLRDYSGAESLVRIHRLSQDRFASWCAGPCGCSGASKVAAVRFKREEDANLGVKSGVLECPDAQIERWLTFHYACTKSMAEKEALMDMSLAMLEEAAPIDTSINIR